MCTLYQTLPYKLRARVARNSLGKDPQAKVSTKAAQELGLFGNIALSIGRVL